VVVVEIPSSDGSEIKRRPAVVLSEADFHRSLPDVIVCQLTSNPVRYRRRAMEDFPLKDWRSCGRRHPSTVRVSRILSVHKRLVGRSNRVLSRRDLARVEGSLRRALGLGR
jgi:mRNA interferase MazF